MAGLWAEKIDHMAAVTNFVVMPMTFLSGTFYLVERLPEPFRTFSRFNPVFYLIDGFRYGFIGYHDASPVVGFVFTGVLTAAFVWACWAVLKSGWRLRA
jgi:ABC-2 type transport system permease protein